MSTPLDATTTPFALSVLTATKGNASKRLIPDVNNRPIKDPAHTLGISAGRVQHVEVTGLADLGALMQRITPQQALVHGIPKGSTPGDIFTLTTAERYVGAPGTIARTLECIDYPPGVRLIMCDYDPAPEAPETIASAHELVARLTGIWPAFRDVGWLATTSTSSAIRDRKTHDWLWPPDGMHVYVLTTGDVARFREIAKVRLWLAGTGYVKLATPNKDTGVASALERALIDLTVFSPERLDFVADAKIDKSAPFYQDRPAPDLHPGVVLDLDTLPDVTTEERADYTRLVAEARACMAPEQRARVRAHITTAAPALPDADVEQEVTTRLDRAERGELDVSQPLYFDNGTRCTAGTLTKTFDGKRLRDPLEPDYGPSQAVFHWRGGGADWRIVSWAHGIKRVYQLAQPEHNAPEPDADDLRDLLTHAPALDSHATGTPSAEPPLPYSDYTNALALVRDHGQDIRYCYPWGKWLRWTGAHWKTENDGAIMRCAKLTIKRLARHAEDFDDDKAVKALLAHVKSSLATAKLKALVESAQSEPLIPVQPEDLDADRWLLNCTNGTLDLKTGTLRPHDRTDLLTRCLPVAYDPQAQCPTWDAFLARIMGGTITPDTPDMSTSELETRQAADDRARALIGFLQRAVGYSLTGDTREQCLFIFWGSGANGKSTLVNTLLALLGPYAMKATAELLMVTRNDRHPTERADLFSTRFVAAIETEEGGRLNEVFVKEATGGDPIRARRMREDFWQFDPTHKVFLATNHKPVIRGTDHAIWRRIKLVPFTVVIPDAEQDKQLPARLYGELPGILAWAVRGCLAWQRTGLGEPAEVTEATAGYRQEMDVFEGFLAEECYTLPSAHVTASAIYDAYERWCKANDVEALTKRAFGLRLSDSGFTPEKGTAGVRLWKGIGLPAKEDDNKRSGA